MLVSIIIPVYNRESIISETLECALNQTYKNLEIIVTDNCSSDNTWSILESYSKKDDRLKIFRNETNLGPVLNWKKCIDNITGVYTKILWSDDLISLDFIEKSIKLMDDDTSFVMSGIRIFNSNDNSVLYESKFQNSFLYTKDQYLKDVLLYGSKDFPVSPGCAFFRTKDIRSSYIEQIPNKQNLDFKKFGAGNDLLFFLITANKYKYVKIINEVSSFFRAHPNSFSVSNDLVIYYEYSKWYFIINFFTTLKKDFKCKLSLDCKSQSELFELYECNNEKISFFSLFLFRIKRKLNSFKTH